jgi:hypothetical protein
LPFTSLIYFPVPLRSTVVTRFAATMRTLTSAGRLTTFLPRQISCVHPTTFAWHTTTKHPSKLRDGFRVSASRIDVLRTKTSL